MVELWCIKLLYIVFLYLSDSLKSLRIYGGVLKGDFFRKIKFNADKHLNEKD